MSKKWDHIYQVGNPKDFSSFRGKVLYDRGKRYLYIVIKGLGKDEIVISGDLPTVERKLTEFARILDQILNEVDFILKVDSPKVDSPYKEG